MAVTPECWGQHLTSAGNHTSQIENCMVISQKLLPKLPTEGFDLRDIVKEEKGALYQTSLPGNQHRGKEQQKDLQKRMLTKYKQTQATQHGR